MVKQVIMAKEMGFCFGVKRALDIVNNQQGELSILGDLIHNKTVIERLKEKGVRFIESIDEAKTKKIVITAHGAADSVKDKVQRNGFEMIDTTCPFVENIHKLTKEKEKEGYFIVLIGKPDHVEVKGIIKDLKHKLVVNNLENVEKLKNERAAVFCQTTQEADKVEKILEKIKKKVKEVEFYDTICEATKSRQSSAKEVAKKADIMIVVGGKHSSNTIRLKEVCSKIVETRHIEFPEELMKDWFKEKDVVGITAGASTPQDIISKVVGIIKTYNGG